MINSTEEVFSTPQKRPLDVSTSSGAVSASPADSSPVHTADAILDSAPINNNNKASFLKRAGRAKKKAKMTKGDVNNDEGETLIDRLEAMFDQRTGEMEGVVRRLEIRIQKLESEQEELTGKNHELQIENDKLKTEMKAVKEQAASATAVCERVDEGMGKLRRDINGLEQYGRRSNLRIFGVDERGGEDVRQKTLEVFSSVGMRLRPSDIEAAHRLGKREEEEENRKREESGRELGREEGEEGEYHSESEDGGGKVGKSRPIIVKLLNRADAEDILKRRRVLKGSGVSVAEDLTRMNYTLMRRAEGEGLIAWSKRGRIYAKREGGRAHIIEGEADFQKVKNSEVMTESKSPRGRGGRGRGSGMWTAANGKRERDEWGERGEGRGGKRWQEGRREVWGEVWGGRSDRGGWRGNEGGGGQRGQREGRGERGRQGWGGRGGGEWGGRDRDGWGRGERGGRGSDWGRGRGERGNARHYY